jgi:membrane protein
MDSMIGEKIPTWARAAGAGIYTTVRARFGVVLRWVLALLREIRAGGLDYRAMGLVYTSLLALIPLLAVAFSVLKAFGAHTELEPLLSGLLEPLGANADEIKTAIIDSVRRLRVGVLGFLGFAFLFYASIAMLDKIEESFNQVWRTRTSRSLLRRLGDYLSFTLVGPLLVFSAFGGLTGLLGRYNHTTRGIAGWAWGVIDVLLPYATIILAFTLFYRVIPSARVRLESALFGGVIAGLLWKAAGWAFSEFVAGSAQYHAVYSSFAILVLFMIWLYVSWLIVLLGAQLCFFYQNPQCIDRIDTHARIGNRDWERSGLAVLYLIGEHFLTGEAPWEVGALAERLRLPEHLVAELLAVLQRGGFLASLDPERLRHLPARDLERISMQEVFAVLRAGNQDEGGVVVPSPVERVVRQVDAAVAATLHDLTLRHWIEASSMENSRNSA